MYQYIKYYDYDENIWLKFFQNKQAHLLQQGIKKKNGKELSEEERLNKILLKEQKNLESLINNYVSEEQLLQALSKAIEKSQNFSMSLEDLTNSINGYFLEADKKSEALRKRYEQGYDEFSFLFNEILRSGRVDISKKELKEWLQSLNPNEIKTSFNDVANPLGKIGELSGIALLNNIADELLQTSFKNRPGIKVEIVNTGKKKTLEKKQTLTTDNILIIKDKNKVLYNLNLSNKINTAFKSAKQKSTKRAVKLSTTTVNAFLKKHKSWSAPTYNIISYHYNNEKGMREDFLNSQNGIARQALGTQILFDHIFGTGGTFEINGDVFKDSVSLIAYGNKIITNTSVLRNALFTRAMKDRKKMVMVQIDSERKKWFINNDIQGKSNIQNIYDAQKRISAFNLIYQQTLYLENDF